MEHGETPWDAMHEKELRLEVWRLYKAAEYGRSCLAVLRCQNEESPYWGIEGAGGHAIDMLEQAMHTGLSLPDDDKEKLWHSFFRNAMPLLFKRVPLWEWIVCEKCQSWFAGSKGVKECITCGNTDLRPIKWSDFRPAKALDGGE